MQVHQMVEKGEKRALEEYLKDSEVDALELVCLEVLLSTEEMKLAFKKDQMKKRKEIW